MSFEEHLEVQEAGGFSIVRFRNSIIEVGNRAEDAFEALRRFVSTFSCMKIAIDVSADPYLPSSVLGLLVRLHTQEGVEVHLVNAPAEVVRSFTSRGSTGCCILTISRSVPGVHQVRTVRHPRPSDWAATSSSAPPAKRSTESTNMTWAFA